MKTAKRTRGLALIFVLLLLTMISYLALSFMLRGNHNLFTVTRNSLSLQAASVAEAAARQKALEVRKEFETSGNIDEALGLVFPSGTLTDVAVYDGEDVSSVLGYANVTYLKNAPRFADVTETFSTDSYVTVTIRAVGSTRRSSSAGRVTRTIDLSYNVGSEGYTDGFNFAYFMNHWAWWSGFQSGKAKLIGNSGANGNFDILDGSIFSKGGPTFTWSADGKDYNGALYTELSTRDSTDYSTTSGIYTTGTISGPGGSSEQQLDGFGHITLPKDLSEISESDSRYQAMAREQQGKITVKTVKLTRNAVAGQALEYTVLSTQTIVSDGVYGDSSGEKENLVIGKPTAESPAKNSTITLIEIDGPVVVKGNVVMQGYVTGRGTLYAGRNLYLAGSVKYANPPSTSPTGTQAVVQDPKASDYNSDQVVYATGGSIISGDVSNKPAWWTGSLDYWLGDGTKADSQVYTQPGVKVDSDGQATPVNVRVNDNHEDNGLDGIVNSQQYMDEDGDGIYAQDKENDGKWTVKLKNTATGATEYRDLAIVNGTAQVPGGYTVVEGTGEDADGDGLYTSAYDYDRDFNFARDTGNNSYTSLSFSSTNFGNFPAGYSSYSTYVQPVNRVDGYLMANNTIAGWFGATSAWSYTTGKDVVFFGGEIARQDGQIVSLGWSGSLQTHQDARFRSSNDIGAPGEERMDFVGLSEP